MLMQKTTDPFPFVVRPLPSPLGLRWLELRIEKVAIDTSDEAMLPSQSGATSGSPRRVALSQLTPPWGPRTKALERRGCDYGTRGVARLTSVERAMPRPYPSQPGQLLDQIRV